MRHWHLYSECTGALLVWTAVGRADHVQAGHGQRRNHASVGVAAPGTGSEFRMTATHAAVPSAWAQRLGYAGVLPFVGLATATWIAEPGHRAFAGLALAHYGAVITSFLGAIHWGLAMREASRQSLALLGWGVLPSLIAWVASMLSPPVSLLAIAALLWACLAVDRVVYPWFQAQGWLPMRFVLTCIASGSCITGAAGLHALETLF